MSGIRWLAPVAVILLGSLPLARAQDTVLVPGDPPLTQGLVDSYTEFFRYLLAIKLDADATKKFQALVVGDWKEWDKAARDAFVKQLAEWGDVSKKSGQLRYCAKLLPAYLDRQGDLKKTSASERWMLETYQSFYKKLAEEWPSAVMDKQPAPLAAEPGKYGFPADPKHASTFPKPVVFTQTNLFVGRLFVDTFYVDRKTGETHFSYQYWWFYPTGRFYTRIIRYEGVERVKGKEKDFSISWFYLDSQQILYDWGRYTIDEKDRIQLESDRGDKVTLHLTHGRQHLNWDGRVFDAPPKKKQ
jgi:hypothetical protein